MCDNTPMNITAVHQGEMVGRQVTLDRTEYELSANGIAWAQELASNLRGDHYTQIYTSHDRPVWQTAGYIRQFHDETPIQFTHELSSEHDLSKTTESLRSPAMIRMLGEASMGTIMAADRITNQRVDTFLSRIYRAHTTESVLVVTDAPTVKAFRRRLFDTIAVQPVVTQNSATEEAYVWWWQFAVPPDGTGRNPKRRK